MCGIAGVMDTRPRSGKVSDAIIRSMTDSLVHRGPDDGGVWVDQASGIGLGNRRLAIIDLSEAGRQPMASSCGHYVIAYNGEIYNAPELRKELEKAGRRFRGYSDTEVIVEGCAAWGVEETARRIIGMFAFALWDKRQARLFLVRDRLGIKPLFWSFSGGLLLFGSELKSLRAHPDFQPALDRSAVASYLRHTFVPAPYSIFEEVHKLEPGKILTLGRGAPPRIETYWALDGVVRDGCTFPFEGSESDAVDALDALLRDAVQRRMVSDVPLGAFLSGGVDSSTVVALMQAQSNTPVRTYSIGFEEEGYNEAHDAAAVARHLGTKHTELYATPDDARKVIPSLPAIYDEPFADSSQIPTYLVSKLTKEHVTVALSGDGGDELFGGYTRYFIADRYGSALVRGPAQVRRAAACVLAGVPPHLWNVLARLIPESRRSAQFGEQIQKLGRALRGGGENGFYQALISHWDMPEHLVAGAREYRTVAWDDALAARMPDFVSRMQYLDTATYLPDDILTKVDRASMAVSLEARVPLLDHRVVEFAWSLPRAMKVRNGQGKWILRQLLSRYLPEDIIKRRKVGFSVPIGEWLRGPLKEWAGDLLSPESISRHGILRPEPVSAAWKEHLSGGRVRPLQLWTVLMFQAWCEEYLV